MVFGNWASGDSLWCLKKQKTKTVPDWESQTAEQHSNLLLYNNSKQQTDKQHDRVGNIKMNTLR